MNKYYSQCFQKIIDNIWIFFFEWGVYWEKDKEEGEDKERERDACPLHLMFLFKKKKNIFEVILVSVLRENSEISPLKKWVSGSLTRRPYSLNPSPWRHIQALPALTKASEIWEQPPQTCNDHPWHPPSLEPLPCLHPGEIPEAHQVSPKAWTCLQLEKEPKPKAPPVPIEAEGTPKA